jgi:hypothetical protein
MYAFLTSARGKGEWSAPCFDCLTLGKGAPIVTSFEAPAPGWTWHRESDPSNLQYTGLSLPSQLVVTRITDKLFRLVEN